MSPTPRWVMAIKVACHYERWWCGGSTTVLADRSLYFIQSGLHASKVVDVMQVDGRYIH